MDIQTERLGYLMFIYKTGIEIEYDLMSDGMLKDMIDYNLINWEELRKMYEEEFKTKTK